MVRATRREPCRGRHRRTDWVQLAALFLTAVTAIAGCVERLL
ncbi:hypothetical protein TUE45_04502 [Streptomyces reticuli]|nr:hypothetical protein TUE45_04502 [Streptomyces reticuli]